MRRFWDSQREARGLISIHAPRAGCDQRRQAEAWKTKIFQSTHPVRGATGSVSSMTIHLMISIHAPRAGCDLDGDGDRHGHPADFNPRTPCGVRRSNHWQRVHRWHFNPRTPCGVRPTSFSGEYVSSLFQSTHPVRGATATAGDCGAATADFNPRTPCGVRPMRPREQKRVMTISIHAPRAGCDDPSSFWSL